MSIKAQPETHLKSLIQAIAGAKAAYFVLAAFVVLAPLMLTAHAPPSIAVQATGAISPAPDAAGTNESAALAQKLTNPLASLISIPIQNWFDFNLGPKKDGFRYTILSFFRFI